MTLVHWEFLKLLLQLTGAIVVARLAVHWALRRYKTEKTWERQSEALTGLLQSLQEMLRVNDRWLAQEMEKLEFSEEFSASLQVRYAAAKKDLERIAAISTLILPKDINETLQIVDQALGGPQQESWFDELDNDGAALKKAHDTLVAQGRQLLGSA